MHLGNVFSALLAWLSAKHQGGEILLRIEDLDPARSRPEYAQQIMEDLRWLGLDWDRQSENQSLRGAAYEAALELLGDRLYPCYCTRDQLHAASAPHASDGRVIYGGTCRNLTPAQRLEQTKAPCLRVAVPGTVISFVDGLQGPVSMNLQQEWGDFILRRADGVAAYQLAVVVDDGAAGITEVVRGRDLLSSTPAQIWLYQCLHLPVPKFYHVPMLLAPDGRRLSKRDRDLDLGQLQKHWMPEQLLGLLAWKCGLLDRWEAISAQELAKDFSWDRVRREDLVINSKNLVK
jgi:glutamyl-tRNA synthetase